MSIFKFLYPQNSLKRKILDIKDDIKKTVSEFCSEDIRVDWLGAYDIAPENLAFWIVVKTDEMKDKLEKDKPLHYLLRGLLEKHNYPETARSSIFIGFESQETVDRDFNGSWYYRYK